MRDLLIRRPLLVFLLCLAGTLLLLFSPCLFPSIVFFSNDGPLGALQQSGARTSSFVTAWFDNNVLGSNGGGLYATITYILQYLISPFLLAKFYVPTTLLILGTCAWFCFRQFKLTPLACLLGGLATVLNSGYFSESCWGVGTHEITAGMSFVAVGLVLDSKAPRFWLRAVLAGMAIGVAVMEGFDIGAFYSLMVAAFVMFCAFLDEGPVAQRVLKRALQLAVVAGFAAFTSYQALTGLIETQIKGVSGSAPQDPEAKARQWDWATQWSFPKKEALSLVIPGLFGYRMDTSENVASCEIRVPYEGGVYWGAIGQDPNWDRWVKAGRVGSPPGVTMRFSGGGNYTGVLVLLIGAWAVAQSLRKQGSVFSSWQRETIWFWIGLVAIALPLSFGRFAPFYQFFYMLPHASNIRNPAKFLHFVNFSAVMFFAFGVDAMLRRYLGLNGSNGNQLAEVARKDPPLRGGEGRPALCRPGEGGGEGAAKTRSPSLKSSPVTADPFDKRWITGCLIALGVSLLGWLIYASNREKLESYLQSVQISQPQAHAVAGFSIAQVAWFLLFLALTVVLVAMVLKGKFNGNRAKFGAILIGVLLVVDLGRANLPWMVFWNYRIKYARDPLINFLLDQKTGAAFLATQGVSLTPALAQKEREVTNVPTFRLVGLQRLLRGSALPPEIAQVESHLDGYYTIEWAQHQFLYYDIQALDPVQMSRAPQDLVDFESALTPTDSNSFWRVGRRWELSNTRYILAATQLLESLNHTFDKGKNRIKIAMRFDIVPRPGLTMVTSYADFMAVTNGPGSCALLEFTGALPRAKLYTDWQVTTNDQTVLQALGSESFDPAKSVFVAGPAPAPPASNASITNLTPVEFVSYTPKDIVFKTEASATSVLLLNDKYDPSWQVKVDGKPAQLLRCNYIMRGVHLKEGPHLVEFHFERNARPLYVTITAIVIGLGVMGFLAVDNRRENLTQRA